MWYWVLLLTAAAAMGQAKTEVYTFDANGRREEVRGPGVVGEQPVLGPGETFRYASGCPLATPSGMMQGSYRMVTDSGAAFDVEIPAFSLDSPMSHPTLN